MRSRVTVVKFDMASTIYSSVIKKMTYNLRQVCQFTSTAQDKEIGYETTFVYCFLAFLSFSTALLAQNDGSISGTVTDSSGAVLAQAAVKMTSREQGTVRTINTNGAGVYQFQFLPAGTYTSWFRQWF